MTAFSHGPVSQIPTSAPGVHAFRIAGRLNSETAEAFADHMNDVFDQPGKVSMLLDLRQYEGSDWDAMLDDDVIESRFRALKKVDKYAVIGAPAGAARMIRFLNKLIPVDARSFDDSEADQAWAFVGATAAA